MNLKEALTILDSLGTEQNRKVYTRHGVRAPLFGVSYANLGKLHKRIKCDHGLARELWGSGVHDARVLATMIADPAQLTSKEADSWVRNCGNYVITDAFAKLVAQSPLAEAKFEAWTQAEGEWVSSAGWSLLGGGLVSGALELDEERADELIARIERDLPTAPNRTRHAMNNALIAIGCLSEALARKAIAAARRIGAVEVDHGETGCKTPDAASYIPKARAYYAAKAGKPGGLKGARKAAGPAAKKVKAARSRK